MDTACRIFELLDKMGMEQKAFAAAVGVSDDTVSNWRRRKSASYSKNLPQIAEVLGTTVQYLLTGEGEKNKQAAIPKDDSLSAEFARLFDTLTPEHKNEIIAEMLKRQRDE